MVKLIFSYPFMKKEYKILKDTILIGRLPNNDISIPDYKLFKNLPSDSQKLYIGNLSKVSRIHARLIKKEDGWYIEDIGTKGLGSNYGTYVNGIRIIVKKPYKLENNDRIKFGPIECIFSTE